MNLDILQKKIDNPEVKYDFRKNPVRVGDIVLYVSNGSLRIDIVKKICPTGIKVVDNAYKTFSSCEYCRAEKLLNDDEISKLRQKYIELIDAKKDVERSVTFCYKNQDGEVGIGSFSFRCPNNKTSFALEIKKHIDNNPNTEFYFLCRKNDEFFFSEKNSISGNILITRLCGFAWRYDNKNGEIFLKYVTEDMKSKSKLSYDIDEVERIFKASTFGRSKKLEFDKDFLFLMPDKYNWSNSLFLFNRYDSKSSYVDEVTFLLDYDKKYDTSYITDPTACESLRITFLDSYVKMYKDFLKSLSNDKHF